MTLPRLHQFAVALLACLVWIQRGSAQPAILHEPRPARAVVDSTDTLTADDAAQIEELARGVRNASGADLMVVVIPTTSGQPHRAFATDLFNRWQLGSADRNDGLLIFVALDDHKAEIILGDGVDSPEQVAASQRIMNEVLLPEFRRGQPGSGLRRAASACASDILGVKAEAPAAAGAASEEPVPTPTAAEASSPPSPEPLPRGLLHASRTTDGSAYALLGGGTAGGIGLSWFVLRRHLRNRPRICPECRREMIRLGETADDPHLDAGQQVEERLHSVDYDVWTCPTCPAVTKVRYGTFFTRYARCPKCRYATKSSTVRRVRSPTTWSSGLEEINERCSNCDFTAQSTRVIPRRSSERSSSSWGSSSGSSGGGRSSGSGASGSW